MSLLTMVQQALREVGEFEVPATVVGNANPTAVQLLALAQVEGRQLSKRHDWNVLLTEQTTNMVADQEAYSLPTDLRFLINATWYDRTQRRQMIGPVSPQQWQFLKSENIGASYERYWRIRGNQILLYPVPTSTDQFAFEYVSNAFCESASGTAQTAWAADTDVGKLDEELMTAGLVWRFLESKGLPFQRQFGEYERTVTRAIGQDGAAPTLRMGGKYMSRGKSYVGDFNINWEGVSSTWGS